MASLYLLFLITCLSITGVRTVSASVPAPCQNGDRQALLDWKGGISSDESGRLAQWDSSSDCCLWIGVTCDPNSGNVISLNLSNENDYGSRMTGFISPSIALLPLLQSLDLSNLENLSGQLPASLFSSTHLKLLNLFNNKFNGRIPPLTSPTLQHLSLARNQFSGPFPADLAALRNLTFLDLSSNPNLKGPFPSSLLSLSKLQTLVIEDLVSMTGSLPPDLSMLVSLTSLTLGALPKITGELPSKYPKSLRTLTISYMSISGSIPSSLGLTCQNLEELHLNNNNRLQGSIPPSLGRLSNLKTLHISDCPGLTGPIPESIGGLSRLQYMTITSCGITGPLPESTGKLSSLLALDLTRNRINGTIPASMGQLSALISLDLYRNNLSGHIPQGFTKNLQKLLVINLGWNNIIGLPIDMSEMTSLAYVYLEHNQGMDLNAISGIGTLPSLFFLTIIGCNLAGPFPAWLTTSRTPDLRHLYMQKNSLTGPIPSNINNLTNLFLLDLSRNKFSGTIPPTLGDLKQLGSLSLSMNKLSGSIPMELSNLDLDEFDISYNRLTGEIPQVPPFTKFSEVSYDGNPGLCGSPLPPCK